MMVTVDGRGLRPDRRTPRACRAAGGDQLRGPQRAAAERRRLRAWRSASSSAARSLMESVFSYPGIGFKLLSRRSGARLPADAGHLPGDHAVRAGRQPSRDLLYGLIDPQECAHDASEHSHGRPLGEVPPVSPAPRVPAADCWSRQARSPGWCIVTAFVAVRPSSVRGSRRTTRATRSDDVLSRRRREHWLGTTHLGQDVLASSLRGTRGSLSSAWSPG